MGGKGRSCEAGRRFTPRFTIWAFNFGMKIHVCNGGWYFSRPSLIKTHFFFLTGRKPKANPRVSARLRSAHALTLAASRKTLSLICRTLLRMTARATPTTKRSPIRGHGASKRAALTLFYAHSRNYSRVCSSFTLKGGFWQWVGAGGRKGEKLEN